MRTTVHKLFTSVHTILVGEPHSWNEKSVRHWFLNEQEANTPDSFHIRPIRQGGLIPESGEYGKSDRKFPNMEKFCGTFFVIQKYHIKATQHDNCSKISY